MGIFRGAHGERVVREPIIIIIIIINEKINVAFSRRTARTRDSHKKHKPRKRRV